MKYVYLLVLILLFSTPGFSQQLAVKGKVSDTMNSKYLANASVVLINSKDSVLEQFTRSKPDGSFGLKVTQPGDYMLMINFPGFAEFADKVHITSSTDLGIIPMISKAHMLEDFVFTKQIAAIKIKGDTTEYVADSFATKQGASVEDLLKKLPGIQVDRNGKITAQGEQVQKILVDGEEFFSDDPAVVTKNLQANAIDKVQVFDKKSDKADFTGIEDGDKIKTINLQLKENRKTGYFGKLIGAAGNKYYENQGMLNAFKGKRKISAFGIVSNTGKIGLGWEDRDKFGSGNSTFVDEGSGDVITYMSNDNDDDFGGGWGSNYNGKGLPKTYTGGLHYSNGWNQDKEHLSGNYRYAKQDLDIISNTLTQYNLPGGTQYKQENEDQKSVAQRHKVDALFEYKYDSLSSLKLTADGGYSEIHKNTNYTTETRDSLGNMINDGDRTISNNAYNQNFDATLLWKKKYNKKGRSLMVSASEQYKNSDGKGYLNSSNSFYSDGLNSSDLFVNQYKVNNTTTSQFSGVITYTEPIAKEVFMELDYGASINNSKAQKLSYNKSQITETYDSLSLLNSSDYDFDVITNKAGTKFSYNHKKIKISAGTNIAFTRFNQTDNLRDTSFHRNYVNLFPQVNFIYTLGKQSSISLKYTGSTQQPSISQIQPLQQNTDPLNISIGNPNLKQEFDHTFNLRFNNYKVLTGTYSYLGGGLTFVNNDISRAESIDSVGAHIYQYMNVNGNITGYMYGGIGWKIRKPDVRVNLNTNINIGHTVNYVNGVHNVNNNNQYSANLSFDKNVKDKWDVSLGSGITYYNNTASIASYTTSYFIYSPNVDASYQLPWKMEIGTSIDWQLRQKTSVFDNNNNVFRWNAYIGKKMLKNDQLQIRVSAFDILNQNNNYSRVGQANSVVESRYNTVKRYGLFSLIWNFTKSPTSAAVQDK